MRRIKKNPFIGTGKRYVPARKEVVFDALVERAWTQRELRKHLAQIARAAGRWREAKNIPVSDTIQVFKKRPNRFPEWKLVIRRTKTGELTYRIDRQ